MAQFIPISKTGHADAGWLKSPHYGFTAAIDMAPLLADEIDQVLAELPLAFRRQSDPSGKASYQLVALLSPLTGRNLLVNPDGSWRSGHVPVLFRGYPFSLMAAQGGQQVVCFDQKSGLLTGAAAPGSTPFFDANGEPTPAFKGVLVFLQQYDQRRALTQQAVDTLAELNLIVPWQLVVKNAAGRQTKGALLAYKINGAALQALTAEPLFRLHQCGALPIAYAQLLSEQRVKNFGKFMEMPAQGQPAQAKPAPSVNLDALFGTDSGLIKFKNGPD